MAFQPSANHLTVRAKAGSSCAGKTVSRLLDCLDQFPTSLELPLSSAFAWCLCINWSESTCLLSESGHSTSESTHSLSESGRSLSESGHSTSESSYPLSESPSSTGEPALLVVFPRVIAVLRVVLIAQRRVTSTRRADAIELAWLRD
jgi:hypothetical protein